MPGGWDDARRQGGGAIKSILLFLALVGVLAVAALGAGGYAAYREATRPGPLTEEKIVMLRSGMTVSQIAELLAGEDVVRRPELFKAMVRVKQAQSSLKAGEYAIPAGASVIDVIALLVEGKSILHFVTAPEGLTTKQILRILDEDAVLVGDITVNPKEGDLLPETYGLTRGESRNQLIRRMMKAQDKLFEEHWDQRALELPYSTREEALILASIVEKETGLAEERPRIAAVFVNRLKRGMRLESDPTVIYGLTEGEPLGRGLRVSELRKSTPYNTYAISGLPPTPIANPGRDAILAVLNPAETDEIFFVADGTGGHVFASTLRDHNRNVAEWRRIEREQKRR